MWKTTLPFPLLGWLVVTLQVKTSIQSCTAPNLRNGYFYPDQVVYPDNQILTYACDKKYKPAVEGWWATITCLNGRWSKTPLCIDEKACLPLSIPNAKLTEGPSEWYSEGSHITFTCEEGYKRKSDCVNGSWSSVPVCVQSPSACGEPPRHLHAVPIHMSYERVFAEKTVLQYGCEEGYTTEGTGTEASITCENGRWSAGPTCRKKQVPDRSESSRDSGGTLVSEASTTASRCGSMPVVENGEIVQNGGDYLKYECALYYKLEGSEFVWCLNDGLWSELPVCKANFCILKTEDYPFLQKTERQFLSEGERIALWCVKTTWYYDYYAAFQCRNGIVIPGECTHYY